MISVELDMEEAIKALSAILPTAAVEAEGLSKAIDGRWIFREVDLRIEPGELVAICGANGAGKSTLLKVIATLTPPTSGSLRLFGQDVIGRKAGVTKVATDLRARVGMVGHQLMLYRDLSARENLEFFARLYDLPDPTARARRMLEMVGLWHRADDPVKTFSRGMAQRVAIARALLNDPDLLLADEPFTGLDPGSSAALESLIRELTDSAGKVVLLVNHDLEQTLRIASRVTVIARGRISLDAPAADVSARNLLKEIS